MKSQKIIPMICLSLFAAGCGNSNKVKIAQTATEDHGQEDKILITATLTQEQIKAVGIQFGTIENKELTATMKANGVLRVPNNNRGNATSMYGGVIKTLNVQIGDHVKKGQLIATIENPTFIQLQEEFLTIGSKVTFAEQEARRQSELTEGTAGALKDLQAAEANLNALATRKASLQQQLELMGLNPKLISKSNLKSTLVVTSPLNGTISKLSGKIGSYVDVTSPVAEIVDNSSLHLDLQVFEKDLPLLKVGQTIHFTLTNTPTSEYDAVVFSIGSSFENDSKTISVHCRVTGSITDLIDGMNITGIVSLNNATMPAVPSEAIVSSGGKDYIFVVDDDKLEEYNERKSEKHEHEDQTKEKVNFEKVEVLKGVTDMGYTAVTLVQEIDANAQIVTKGAFFVNATLTNSSEHEH